MAHRHLVKFFEDERNLFATVARFIGDGLAAGQPALVIATPWHRRGILEHLGQHVSHAGGTAPFGGLVMIDAEATLSRFMAGDEPDAGRFMHTIGDLVEGLPRGAGYVPVRAYGEMVDLLWRAGRTEATIELEHLWNAAAAAHHLSLLCGYCVRHISDDMERLQHVCCLHTDVIAPSEVTNPLGSAT